MADTKKTTAPKYAHGQNPNSKKNLRMFTSGGENPASVAGRKGAIATNKKKAELKNQMAILQYCLKNDLAKLPFTKEKIKEYTDKLGIKPKTTLEWAHVLTTIDEALHGNLGYSKKLWEADGSDQPQPIQVQVSDHKVEVYCREYVDDVKNFLNGGALPDLDE